MLEVLGPEPGDVILDGTLGTGGHSERIAEMVGPEGTVIGIDRDAEILPVARRRLARFEDRVRFENAEFSKFDVVLDRLGIDRIDGALLDIGVSSVQLDTPERGFSFRHEGPLDMRMSRMDTATAADLLDKLDVGELETLLREYGEEPRARAIAMKIVEVRRRTRITTTKELAELVRSVIPAAGKTHPATRTFQALRIAVNRELEVLEAALPRIVARLAGGARLVVITFHSLEDRIVKHAFREMERSGVGRVIDRESLSTGIDERSRNPRSRSAKTRAFERSVV